MRPTSSLSPNRESSIHSHCDPLNSYRLSSHPIRQPDIALESANIVPVSLAVSFPFVPFRSPTQIDFVGLDLFTPNQSVFLDNEGSCPHFS
jgi:hypothetical protein